MDLIRFENLFRASDENETLKEDLIWYTYFYRLIFIHVAYVASRV